MPFAHEPRREIRRVEKGKREKRGRRARKKRRKVRKACVSLEHLVEPVCNFAFTTILPYGHQTVSGGQKVFVGTLKLGVEVGPRHPIYLLAIN